MRSACLVMDNCRGFEPEGRRIFPLPVFLRLRDNVAGKPLETTALDPAGALGSIEFDNMTCLVIPDVGKLHVEALDMLFYRALRFTN